MFRLCSARPKFAHLPYVAEPGSQNKLSKRKIAQYLKHPDFKRLYDHALDIATKIGHATTPETFNPFVVDFYRVAGYLPDAIINYLLLLGWSLDDYLQRASLVPAPPPSAIGPHIARVIAAAGDRIKTMGDILQFREFFVADDALPVQGPEFEKLLKAPGAAALLRELAARFESVAAFEAAALEQELKTFVVERNLKVGQLVHPLRFAMTGRTVGLGLYDALAILGRERSLARIRRAASAVG